MWPTSEHYFQAQKFAGHPDEEEVRQAGSPMIAARMGRSRKRPFRKDWETVKLDVMREVVRAKFTQHPELMAVLLGTDDAPLVEHTANDAYWADGGDGSGQNWLGRILMEVREELRALSAFRHTSCGALGTKESGVEAAALPKCGVRRPRRRFLSFPPATTPQSLGPNHHMTRGGTLPEWREPVRQSSEKCWFQEL